MPAAAASAAPATPMSAPQLQRALAEAQDELLAGSGAAALRPARNADATTGTLAAVTRAGSRLERIVDAAPAVGSAAPSPLPRVPKSGALPDDDDEHDALPASRLRLAPSVLRTAAPHARHRASSAASSASGSSTPSSPRSPLSPGLASPPPQWATALSWSPPRGPSPAPGAPSDASPRELPGIAAARALLGEAPARPRWRPTAALLACAERGTTAHGEASLPGTARLDTHGTASRSATPSFFLQSFPDNEDCHAEATHHALPLFFDSSAEPSPSLSAGLLSSSPASSTQRRSALASPRLPTTASASPALLSKSTAPSALSSTSATVRLHGNARSAREYGDVGPADEIEDSFTRARSARRDDGSSDESLAELAPEIAARPRLRRSASGSSNRSWQSGTSVGSAEVQSPSRSSASERQAPAEASISPAPNGQTHGRFARDVHCIGWVEIGGKAKGHVEYEIRVLTKEQR
ncbi:hypothetical protein FA09DRAFT_341562 [Tilletiopsis washingtonensis]|uniref:Uncharacterized protein n=1 Tax=Tilletiopsis washingtonensis TaxID=58919 RepID=A0A316Z181_9BASI|nr:hypothetical protein FA09DRAFT_341562 [Tilletiopsis washingtonensis]PWN94834.1 hypothetical protein FA09DRAFT_341562 [Tilletiopsis washingtonensis]